MSFTMTIPLSKNCMVAVNTEGEVFGERGKMRPSKDSSGYLQVHTKAGVFLVHRLVARAFLSNPGKLETVDHIDNNPLNNHVSNLQWMSVRDNIRKSQAKAVIGHSVGVGHYYPAISDVKGDQHDPSAVAKVCKGALKQHHNLIWEYV